MVALAITLLLAAGGGSLVVSGLRDLWKHLASNRWPAVEGRIVVSDVISRKRRDNGGHVSTEWVPVVHYEFAINGRTITGHRIRTGWIMNWESAARATAARYPVGRSLPVHVDPSNPNQSVLEIGFDPTVLLTPAVGVLLVFGGLVVFAFRNVDFGG